MIYQVTLDVGGVKRNITNYSYRCHVPFSDSMDFAKLIQIFNDVKRKGLPVEGDLITLTFNSTDNDQFFYDWCSVGVMRDGEIIFSHNVIEVDDIFRFWDCYCVGVEEYMSVDGAPMSLTVYLSHGIIKRNNLPAREKIWKISDISLRQPEYDDKKKEDKKKKPQIESVYWKDAKGIINIDELPEDEIVTLYAKIKNAQAGDKVSFTITDEENSFSIKIENCAIDSSGIAIVKNFNLNKYRNNKNK